MVWTSLSCSAASGCGDDGAGTASEATGGSTGSTTEASGTTDGTGGTEATSTASTTDATDTTPTTGTPGTTEVTTTDATTTPDTTTTDATGTSTTGETTGETTGAGDCQAWEIVYDLTDSEFEISDTPLGAGDQVNVLMEPYDDNEHIGPGQMVLRFRDVGGEPGAEARITSYEVDLQFVVDGATKVTTDLDVSAADACGVAVGPLAGDKVTWNPAEMANVHTVGSILCEGNLCGLGGLPNGMPVPKDDTAPQPLNPFTFSADLGGFTMPQVVIAKDDQSTTSWTYVGTEVSRMLVAAPACYCE